MSARQLEPFATAPDTAPPTPAKFPIHKPSYKTWDDDQISDATRTVLNHHFRLLFDPDGKCRTYAVLDREATLVHGSELLVRVIHSHLYDRYAAIPPRLMLDKAIELWRRTQDACLSEEPTFVAFKSDGRLTYRRLDFDPAIGEFPAWLEFLGRLSDHESFMAFVWSCFVLDNKSRQFVWLYGEGEDGKSTVLGVLADLFGKAAHSVNGSALRGDNRFLMSSLYGRRALFYPDCKDPKLAMSEFIRNVTSGDAVPIEFKGETPFMARLRLKLIVASNSAPMITSGRSDTSRLLRIDVKPNPIGKDDSTWSDRLRTELPAFLYECKAQYERLCPTGGNIVISDATKDLLTDSVETHEEDFNILLQDWFVLDSSAVMTGSEFQDVLDTASKISERKRLPSQEVKLFKDWLQRRHGVTHHTSKSGRSYRGIRSRL